MMPTAPEMFAAPRASRSSARFFPMSRAEMDALGWDVCDVIIVTGDAYIDHPSFGMAVIGRVLEAHGFRVGMIAQPDWQSAEAFRVLGRPRLYFGVTAGNMDSMVNRYTSERRLRHNDAYTPNGEGGKRPDRAAVVYAQRCREAFKGVPVVLGGIEASLRRVAHFDYWSEKVRRSILFDAKADILLYGNAERAVVELTRRMDAGEALEDLRDIRGTAVAIKEVPPGWHEVDRLPRADEEAGGPRPPRDRMVVRLPSYEAVKGDPVAYAHASRALHLETNPGNARPLVQAHGDRELWLNPPPIPLQTPEMDGVYDLPYARGPHPTYDGQKIPAWEMIRFSVIIERGCFGGCTFCSITEHEGRIIQTRSQRSILSEIEKIRDEVPGFTGVISDLGGPTANMYGLKCKSPEIEAACRKPSCVFPDVCPNLLTDHSELIDLYRQARKVEGVKKVFVASGVRYDLAVKDPRYIDELARHHIGGYLKIAPEHVAEGPLAAMMKPGMGAYDQFAELFAKASEKAGKQQYLIPYFIAAHPGTTLEDMLELALWVKRQGLKLDQVQTFLPTPMATATAMYHTGKNPLRPVRADSPDLVVPEGARLRRIHKAFLRFHDPENWDLLRFTLRKMGRTDLVGMEERCLVPPEGTKVERQALSARKVEQVRAAGRSKGGGKGGQVVGGPSGVVGAKGGKPAAGGRGPGGRGPLAKGGASQRGPSQKGR